MKWLNSYEGFASIYDQLMDDAYDEEWFRFLHATIRKHHPRCKKILDLGCGTGKIAVKMAKMGYSMTGVDLSEEMLAVAQQRLQREHLSSVRLIQQDMRELELNETFDMIYSFCDALNYLVEEEDVISTIKRVAEHLEQHGLFLFDVHSLYKLNHVYARGPIVQEDEELAYIWVPEVDIATGRVDHHLHFFVREEDDLYRRFYEIHQQRVYSMEQWKEWLQSANFEILAITTDFEERAPLPESERIFFVAKKEG